MPSPEDELTVESRSYLARRPKSERSSIGQFLTPRRLRERLVDHVNLSAGYRVLDPGVGTGEFLRTCSKRQPGLELVGWDIDQQALDVAKQLVPTAELRLVSALEVPPSGAFDVVIGNPPYFEIRNMDSSLRTAYSDVLSGRPNIFSTFFKVGLNALKPGGQLGYVVPPSMNNGAFFAKLREYIQKHASIEFLEVYTDTSLFEDAQTAVQLIVLRKGASSDRYTVDLAMMGRSPRHRILFTPTKEEVIQLYRGRTSLWHLGYEAVTGALVWNQHKDELRREPSRDAVALIWAHNIRTDQTEIVLDPTHPTKLQYVVSRRRMVGPAIVVNRITGSVGSGTLRCSLVPDGMEFIGENHVNVIRPRRDVGQLCDWMDLLDRLRESGVSDRVQLLTGNTQLSATELTHWLPIASTQAEEAAEPDMLF